MKLHETDDGFFCFLDEPTDSILWLAFFRSRETALRAWELAQASAAAPDTTERLSITTHMLENLVADMRTGKRFSEQAVANVHMVIEANRAAIARALAP